MARFDYPSASPASLEYRDGRTMRLRVAEADTLPRRALGLSLGELGRLPDGTGVLFDRCRCVHTVGMGGPVSLIWIAAADRRGSRRVVSVDPAARPLRIYTAPRGAVGVIEARAMPREAEADPPLTLTMEGGRG